MTILKIVLIFFAIAFITFSVPTLMSTDLVSSTTTNFEPQITLKFGFFKFSVESPNQERIYFDYADLDSFDSGIIQGSTDKNTPLKRQTRSGTEASSSSMSSSPITSKTYTSFGLLLAANILLTVLVFVFWFEIFYLKKLVIFFLLSMAVFTIAAFSLVITLVQTAQDFTLTYFFTDATLSSKIDSGAFMFIAVISVAFAFILSAFFFMRQKGFFSETTAYIPQP